MRYLGSKRRFIKELLPILMEHKNEADIFIDAFMGGCNVISEVPMENKLGIELNSYIASFWHNVKFMGSKIEEILPDEMSVETYNKFKTQYINKTYNTSDKWFIGYVGSALSFGGAWFNGLAKYNPKKNENHVKEAKNGLLKQIKGWNNMDGTEFLCCSYDDDMAIQDFIWNKMFMKGRFKKESFSEIKSIIYCDPPYRSTKSYESDFDHDKFWDWVRKKSKDNFVYVSEYDAPDDFKCVWEKDKKDSLGSSNRKNKDVLINTEKLFMYNE